MNSFIRFVKRNRFILSIILFYAILFGSVYYFSLKSIEEENRREEWENNFDAYYESRKADEGYNNWRWYLDLLEKGEIDEVQGTPREKLEKIEELRRDFASTESGRVSDEFFAIIGEKEQLEYKDFDENKFLNFALIDGYHTNIHQSGKDYLYEFPEWLERHVYRDEISSFIKDIAINVASSAAYEYYIDTNNYKEFFEDGYDMTLFLNKTNYKEYESTLLQTYFYTGGAHSIHAQGSYIINTETGEDVSIDEYLKEIGYDIDEFHDLLFKRMLKEKKDEIFDLDHLSKYLPEGYDELDGELFKNSASYMLTEDGGLYLLYDPYVMGPWSSGVIEIFFPNKR